MNPSKPSPSANQLFWLAAAALLALFVAMVLLPDRDPSAPSPAKKPEQGAVAVPSAQQPAASADQAQTAPATAPAAQDTPADPAAAALPPPSAAAALSGAALSALIPTVVVPRYSVRERPTQAAALSTLERNFQAFQAGKVWPKGADGEPVDAASWVCRGEPDFVLGCRVAQLKRLDDLVPENTFKRQAPPMGPSTAQCNLAVHQQFHVLAALYLQSGELGKAGFGADIMHTHTRAVQLQDCVERDRHGVRHLIAVAFGRFSAALHTLNAGRLPPADEQAELERDELALRATDAAVAPVMRDQVLDLARRYRAMLGARVAASRAAKSPPACAAFEQRFASLMKSDALVLEQLRLMNLQHATQAMFRADQFAQQTTPLRDQRVALKNEIKLLLAQADDQQCAVYGPAWST